jgi:hypothetical protein
MILWHQDVCPIEPNINYLSNLHAMLTLHTKDYLKAMQSQIYTLQIKIRGLSVRRAALKIRKQDA